MAKKSFKTFQDSISTYSALNMERDEDGDLSPTTYNAIKERIERIKAEIKDGKAVNFQELKYLQTQL